MVDKLIVPRRLEDWIDPKTGNFTLRALNFFEFLTGITNFNSDAIENNTEEINGPLSARLLSLEKQVGSGIPLTIDTTGFTVDTTFQFTDQTEV